MIDMKVLEIPTRLFLKIWDSIKHLYAVINQKKTKTIKEQIERYLWEKESQL